ncbi:hypothetical protein SEET0012_01243 [Salmonella enterica subsp. enterica serovar Tallahassee str. 0012]|nr:hypothetical protein SEENP079_00492 [Salmonella enterica subsp. enterica serovar Newport str. RI_10P079]ESC78579.1 hypothetical protein SEEN2572_00350 [Salmonella enterica subsp. enterica serovar Newport str. VA_R100512572]ESF31337.1 hypothetical protein SEET0012_01243 [Salmonella enterica subsp. enterica serovar Tallahassee str. 0012]ESH41351.1 hypothetical protein SEEBA664_11101 [Salmonella enterica subsp. enterica serovar Braenderup str. ATCC BAA-664]OSJ45651.1 hypothetical protein K791_1
MGDMEEKGAVRLLFYINGAALIRPVNRLQAG